MPSYEIMSNWTAGVLEAIAKNCSSNCTCNCVCACPQGNFSSTSSWKNTNNTDSKNFSEEQLGAQLYIQEHIVY